MPPTQPAVHNRAIGSIQKVLLSGLKRKVSAHRTSPRDHATHECIHAQMFVMMSVNMRGSTAVKPLKLRKLRGTNAAESLLQSRMIEHHSIPATAQKPANFGMIRLNVCRHSCGRKLLRQMKMQPDFNPEILRQFSTARRIVHKDHCGC